MIPVVVELVRSKNFREINMATGIPQNRQKTVKENCNNFFFEGIMAGGL